MLKQSTWLHLRLPFSFYLMPVYLFALSVSDRVYIIPAILVFVSIHFFLYPASNAFNSYFDKDEESIGGLEKPPPVSRELFYTANVLDVMAVLMGLLLSWQFSLMLIIYSLVSRAYSHPAVRLKRYPILSWLVAGFFQGFFTFAMVYIGISRQPLESFWELEKIVPALLSSLLLWSSYPMTQVYQHREDARRGDYTLSRMLGVKGTFYFTALVFILANVGFIAYYTWYYSLLEALLFQLFLLPMLTYFIYWLFRVHKNITQANFRNTMWLSTISAICLNLFFSWFSLVN